MRDEAKRKIGSSFRVEKKTDMIYFGFVCDSWLTTPSQRQVKNFNLSLPFCLRAGHKEIL
jgi:hypothetical protein